MSLLELKNITKSFDGKVVIDDISLDIESGKIVGLLGKNGCGKTTLIKLINDLLTPDSGQIILDGITSPGPKTKAFVSYLPERTYFDPGQTVKEVFQLFEDFYADFNRTKAEQLLKDLDLDIEAKFAKMSKGMKEKVQLILVMSRNAKLYILDEPLGGVDPATREYILRTILSNFGEESSLIITTHLVADVEKILDDVIIINNGKVLINDSADTLRATHKMSIDEIFRRLVK